VIHDITKILADSQALTEIAIKCGVTIAQARLVAAALGELPAEQVIRLCGVARERRIQQINRETRR
jgi:hypothetical protein